LEKFGQEAIVRGSLLVVDNTGKAVITHNDREMAIRKKWTQITDLEHVTFPDSRRPDEQRAKLREIAQSMHSGHSLYVLGTPNQREVCSATAPSLDEAYAICSQPAQIIGTTGSGGDPLIWKRPPGKMRMAVVSPYVGIGCFQAEVSVEADKSYFVQFDRLQGAFTIESH
jgi:hypothetical protein